MLVDKINNMITQPVKMFIGPAIVCGDTISDPESVNEILTKNGLTLVFHEDTGISYFVSKYDIVDHKPNETIVEEFSPTAETHKLLSVLPKYKSIIRELAALEQFQIDSNQLWPPENYFVITSVVIYIPD